LPGAPLVQTRWPMAPSAQETHTESSKRLVFQTVAGTHAPPAGPARPDQSRAAPACRHRPDPPAAAHPAARAAPTSGSRRRTPPLADEPVARRQPGWAEQQRGVDHRPLPPGRPVHHRAAPQRLGQRDRDRPSVADIGAAVARRQRRSRQLAHGDRHPVGAGGGRRLVGPGAGLLRGPGGPPVKYSVSRSGSPRTSRAPSHRTGCPRACDSAPVSALASPPARPDALPSPPVIHTSPRITAPTAPAASNAVVLDRRDQRPPCLPSAMSNLRASRVPCTR
jgi:hypothetical protein